MRASNDRPSTAKKAIKISSEANSRIGSLIRSTNFLPHNPTPGLQLATVRIVDSGKIAGGVDGEIPEKPPEWGYAERDEHQSNEQGTE